jgi:hypothetical protein
MTGTGKSHLFFNPGNRAAVTIALESVPRALNLLDLKKANTTATTSAKATRPKPIQSLLKKLRREGSTAAVSSLGPVLVME